MKKSSSESKTHRKPSTSSRKSSSAGAASTPKIALAKDLREFVESCASTKVEFLLVGGFALAFHGAPRFTQDIDLFVAMTEENATKIEKILREFGVSSADVSREDLLIPGQIVQVGRPPNRVDVLTSIDGVTWAEAWASRKSITLSGVDCYVIGLECLIQNKKASARPQDLVDVANLQSAN